MHSPDDRYTAFEEAIEQALKMAQQWADSFRSMSETVPPPHAPGSGATSPPPPPPSSAAASGTAGSAAPAGESHMHARMTAIEARLAALEARLAALESGRP